MRFQNHEIFRSVIEVLADRCERVLAESKESTREGTESPSWLCSPGARTNSTPFRGKPGTPMISSSQMCHLKVRQLVANVCCIVCGVDILLFISFLCAM